MRVLRERKLNPGEKAEDLWPKEDSLRQQILDVLKGAYKFSCSTKQNIDSFWKKIKGSQTWPVNIYGRLYFNENATHYRFQICFKHPTFSYEALYWYVSEYVGKGIDEFLDDIEDAFAFYSEIENAKQTKEQYVFYCSFPPKNTEKDSKKLEN